MGMTGFHFWVLKMRNGFITAEFDGGWLFIMTSARAPLA
jgi:hypothetical protein